MILDPRMFGEKIKLTCCERQGGKTKQTGSLMMLSSHKLSTSETVLLPDFSRVASYLSLFNLGFLSFAAKSSQLIKESIVSKVIDRPGGLEEALGNS